MRDGGWRARIRWVVVHPDLPEVLLAHRDGGLALPEAERPGQVWVGDPAAVLPPLRELLGGDAVLLGCLDEVEDPSARVQRVTMLAAARAPATPPEGTAWLDRTGLTAATAGPRDTTDADPGLALAARVAADLESGRPPARAQPWTAPGWHVQAQDWVAAGCARRHSPEAAAVAD